jgi:Ca2+-binding RTX toxin-like protein
LVYAPDQGGSGSQVVLGTTGGDYLEGGSGHDILCGLGGDDVLAGGSGDDRLDAGSGSNELYGGSGYDILIGMAGDVFDQGSGGGEIIANDPGPLVSTVTVSFRNDGGTRCYADVTFDGFTPGTWLSGWTIIGAESDGSGGIHHTGFSLPIDSNGHYAFTDVSGARGDIYNGLGYYQVQLVDGTPLMAAVPIVC